MLIGYAWVSTDDQDLTLQRTALKEAGCRRVYEEKLSGDKPGPTHEIRGSIWQADGIGFSPREEEKAMLEALINKFAQIEDPRCDWRVEHKLLDILAIAVCAVIGEAESFEDIALYGRCKRDWLPLPRAAGRHPFARHLPPGTDAD